MRRALTAALMPALALGLVALAGPAEAATGAHAAPHFSGCGWKPANNSNLAGSFNANGVNIRTGADTSCGIIGEGYTNHVVTVRCTWFNSGDGRWWDYLTDYTIGKTGWSADDYVNWSGSLKGC